MYMEHILSKGQLVPLAFGQAAAAASQAGVALTFNGVASFTTAVPMPWNYEVVGLSFDISAAATVGVGSVAPTIAGTVQAGGSLVMGTVASGYLRIPRGKIKGVAGDLLGVKVTTDGTWDPTTAKLGTVLWVIAHLGGI